MGFLLLYKMLSFAKTLPVLFILLQMGWAEEKRSSELDFKSSPLENTNYLQRIHIYNEDNFEKFFLLSSNYPSKLSFRASSIPDYKYDAFIERLSFNSNSRKICSFPVFGYDPTTYYIRLESTNNDYEIFQVIKTYDNPATNLIDIYIINMANCQYTKNEVLKGYDYFNYGGSFLVYNPRNEDYFDFFSFNGQETCGSYICKHTYNFAKQSFGKPMAFGFSNNNPNTKLLYIGSSSDQGYFAISKNGNKYFLYSLTSNGDTINTINESYDKMLKLLRVSTSYEDSNIYILLIVSHCRSIIFVGTFGACYFLEGKEKEVFCLQFDNKLNYKFNKSLNLDYETKHLAIYNLNRDGLLLLSTYCENNEYEKCQEFRLTKFDSTGAYSEFSKFRDATCFSKKHQFTFFEEDGNICLFYICDSQQEKNTSYDYIIRSRCF
ncbi:PREDICTED: uncharacterized protein LOC105365996 [Ceratosolen solmsi marchali]|uniref:Uncharacterized protein LOC105365996 n=1 Tax=Ceratosolen solmsi marchali TaxID=326594 RepID=A0AAJ7DZY8_9HYME|nr:PREDICTED: uncharacterized protein LOC105365996 [Ceratosolen solmsi marchali]